MENIFTNAKKEFGKSQNPFSFHLYRERESDDRHRETHTHRQRLPPPASTSISTSASTSGNKHTITENATNQTSTRSITKDTCKMAKLDAVVGEAFDVAYNIYAFLHKSCLRQVSKAQKVLKCKCVSRGIPSVGPYVLGELQFYLQQMLAIIARCKTVVLATPPTQDSSASARKLFAKAPPQNFQVAVYAYRDETTAEFCRLEGGFCTQRGLNNPIKQVEIRNFIQAHRLSLIGARIVVAWDSETSLVNVLFSSDQMLMPNVILMVLYPPFPFFILSCDV
ncbi:hypothetical protein Vadar_021882 [Vaccinium darrowii]|uniref:Uncharacterized protein n=1 Tax=Vaccinium darrowii TaxID=229202 RepID=A0ACB7YYA9_9ERIC|nr:hypothetical protein Vadar_021882 [Vaccinium darrowii]